MPTNSRERCVRVRESVCVCVCAVNPYYTVWRVTHTASLILTQHVRLLSPPLSSLLALALVLVLSPPQSVPFCFSRNPGLSTASLPTHPQPATTCRLPKYWLCLPSLLRFMPSDGILYKKTVRVDSVFHLPLSESKDNKHVQYFSHPWILAYKFVGGCCVVFYRNLRMNPFEQKTRH